MGNFNRGGFGGRDGGRPFQKKGFGNRGETTMHKTTCSECSRSCEVPFRPTGEKPVYCKECFMSMGGGDRSDRDKFTNHRFNNRDNKSFSKPSYDNKKPFEKTSAPANDEMKKQFETLNVKLDRLINGIETLIRVKSESITETVKIPVAIPVKSSVEKAVKKETKVVKPVASKKSKVVAKKGKK